MQGTETFWRQRGCGSVGRASPCQGEGRGFESRHPLGRLAQRERASLTRKRSLVRSQYRPRSTFTGLAGVCPAAQAVHADVAQLVEHHLAKVRVAGSSPVIRSQSGIHTIPLGVVGWPRGEAAACKAVYTGSNPVPTSGDWRRGSALPSHGRGHWFDPSIAHHVSRIVRSGFLYFPSCCVMLWVIGYSNFQGGRNPWNCNNVISKISQADLTSICVR